MNNPSARYWELPIIEINKNPPPEGPVLITPIKGIHCLDPGRVKDELPPLFY